MDNVEKRYCMIVECLAASDVYLASGRIAETLQVSAKTVRKDLEKMCPQLEEIGIYIRKKPGLGYFMDAESKAIWRSSEKNLFEKSVHFAKQYRTHYILQRLLSSEAYIKSAELAEELFVSQVAISAELKTIRRYLADYELTIGNTPNHGIRIQGKEQYIRSCMLSEYSCCIDRGIRMVPAFRRLFSLRPSQAGIVKDTVRIFLIEKEGKPYYIHDRCAEQLIYGIALMHNCASRSRQMCFTDKEIYETQLTRSYQAIQQVTAFPLKTYCICPTFCWASAHFSVLMRCPSRRIIIAPSEPQIRLSPTSFPALVWKNSLTTSRFGNVWRCIFSRWRRGSARICSATLPFRKT